MKSIMQHSGAPNDQSHSAKTKDLIKRSRGSCWAIGSVSDGCKSGLRRKPHGADIPMLIWMAGRN